MQSVDFFTPVVDDPALFGEIAAANSLSDIYASGAEPAVAMALAAFPTEVLPIEVLEEILRGGSRKAAEAGAVVAGGHTIDHDVPIYGLSVTGIAREDDVTRHDAALPGDELVLSKPLGLGLLVAAGRKDSNGGPLHRRILSDDDLDRAGGVMSRLNRVPASLFVSYKVRAATDVTGFGLLGHALNLAEGSDVTVRIDASAVPVIPKAREIAARGMAPGGSRKNYRYLRPKTEWRGKFSEEQFLLLVDAQTSGGLLVCVPEGRGAEFAAACREAGDSDTAVIGAIERRSSAPLLVNG